MSGSDDKVILDPSELEPVDGYKLLIGLVVPRPIAWVGTRDEDGRPNLAPYSFFNGVAATPPHVMFSTVGSGASAGKDTLRNVRATGEFSVSLVTEEVAEPMNVTSGNYPPDVNEFEVAGVTPVAGVVIGAPLVAEAKAGFECRMVDIVHVGEMPMPGNIVIGEVVRFHILGSLLDGTRIDQAALRAVGRLGGPQYTRTREIFSMERPKV